MGLRHSSGREAARSCAAAAIAALLGGTGIAAAQGPAPAPVGQAAAPRTAGPPNIVLILADDLGVEALNAYGGEYHTPNLDRLAAEGMRFDNAHATPLCSPSRTRLMTGLENHRNYQAFGYLAPGQRTFANMLRDAGYATGMVGKWQLMGNGFDGRVGITPEAAGFDESYLWQLKALDPKGSRYWGPTRVQNGRTRISEEGFGPDLDGRYALDFIDRHRDRPFFLYYSMVLVHNPFVATPDTPNAEGAKARFAGMMTYMDRLVGDVMAKLKAAGIDRDTVVIFTGDNGTNRQITSTRDGHAVRGDKGAPTVGGTHVPFIVRGPGVAAGSVSPALVDFADMMPTLAAIAGKPGAAGAVDGVDQWPVMTGAARAARSSIFMHYAPRWQFAPARFAFDADWKLYGDGRFVRIDPVASTETEVPAGARRGVAAQRYKALARVLAEAKDGPLDPERYPWCGGQRSIDPALPATVAGCANMPRGEE